MKGTVPNHYPHEKLCPPAKSSCVLEILNDDDEDCHTGVKESTIAMKSSRPKLCPPAKSSCVVEILSDDDEDCHTGVKKLCPPAELSEKKHTKNDDVHVDKLLKHIKGLEDNNTFNKEDMVTYMKEKLRFDGKLDIFLNDVFITYPDFVTMDKERKVYLFNLTKMEKMKGFATFFGSSHENFRKNLNTYGWSHCTDEYWRYENKMHPHVKLCMDAPSKRVKKVVI